MIKHWRARLRIVIALAAAIVVGWRLDALSWPWWAWLPATILIAMSTYMILVVSWFAYRKLTYERFAHIARKRHQAEAEG